MSETERASRPRLSLGTRATTTAAFEPQKQTRPQLRIVQPDPEDRTEKRSTQSSIDSMLAPIRSHFDLADDKVDELAAFARMLLSGSRPASRT
jgi:hypothetical protein